MADRKKAKQAAIDFSTEMATPAVPKAAPTSTPKKPTVTASEILPGLRKSQREAAVPVHKRAASDKASRKAEVAQGIDEARMPRQALAEQLANREKAPKLTKLVDGDAAAKSAAEKERLRKAYEETPVSPREAASIKANRIKNAKVPAGGSRPKVRRGGKK